MDASSKARPRRKRKPRPMQRRRWRCPVSDPWADYVTAWQRWVAVRKLLSWEPTAVYWVAGRRVQVLQSLAPPHPPPDYAAILAKWGPR